MSNIPIYFHKEDVDFELDSQVFIREWILSVIQKEQHNVGDINYIFCTDEHLLKINQQYLQHDTFTDIVTFNYCTNSTISGDLFISIDRIKENSENQNALFLDELNRVMVHGILHLIGYNDKTSEEQLEMRAKEDFYLNLRTNF